MWQQKHSSPFNGEAARQPTEAKGTPMDRSVLDAPVVHVLSCEMASVGILFSFGPRSCLASKKGALVALVLWTFLSKMAQFG